MILSMQPFTLVQLLCSLLVYVLPLNTTFEQQKLQTRANKLKKTLNIIETDIIAGTTTYAATYAGAITSEKVEVR